MLCNACYQYYNNQNRISTNAHKEVSMKADDVNTQTLANTDMQLDSLDRTSLLRSASINMLVDLQISSAATTTVPTCSTFPIL